MMLTGWFAIRPPSIPPGALKRQQSIDRPNGLRTLLRLDLISGVELRSVAHHDGDHSIRIKCDLVLTETGHCGELKSLAAGTADIGHEMKTHLVELRTCIRVLRLDTGDGEVAILLD